MTATIDWRNLRGLLLLGLYLAVVIGVGALIGVSTSPGDWYASIEKPSFNPPSWIFAPIWFTLYILIAIAGWRTFMLRPTGVAMGLWIGQMALNWLWSPVWFTLHWQWPAFIVIVALLVTIFAFIRVSWREDRVSAWLFLPYAAWVGFASILNLSIALMN